MMITGYTSTIVDSKLMRRLENFLDSHTDDICKSLFDKLDAVMVEIDEEAKELEDNYESLEKEASELTDRVAKLEKEVEELNDRL